MASMFGKRAHAEVESSDDEDYLSKKLFAGGTTALIAESDSDESDSEDNDEAEVQVTQVEARSAWHDDDDEDEDTEINLRELRKKSRGTNVAFLRKEGDDDTIGQKDLNGRLRDVYSRVMANGKTPKWAKIEKVAEEGSDGEIDELVKDVTRSVGKYVGKSERLPSKVINSRRVQNLTVGHKDSQELTVVKYHKSKPVVITGGLSGTLRLFQVDNEVKKEHYLQSVKFPRFPITSCEIIEGGTTLLVGSKSQTYLMKYNMDTGNASQLRVPPGVPLQNAGHFCTSSDGTLMALVGFSGQVYILSVGSMELVHRFAAPRDVKAIKFFPGSNDEVWAVTENGEVFCWNISSCSTHSFLNEGAVHGTALAISPDGTWLAVGENTGFVNVYDIDKARKETSPKAHLSISTLTTSVDSMAFNHDSQLLAISSSVITKQLRLVHVDSGSTYQNFPGRMEIPCVTAVDFSPHSGYLAYGTVNGELRMDRLEHFESY